MLDSLDAPPDLAIVELGGNDCCAALPPAETRDEPRRDPRRAAGAQDPGAADGHARAAQPRARAIVREFDGIYPALARAATARRWCRSSSQPVWDKPALIQDDRVHPTAEGIEALVAATADDVATALPDED